MSVGYWAYLILRSKELQVCYTYVDGDATNVAEVYKGFYRKES